MSKTIANVIWKPQGKYLECRAADFLKAHGMKDWKELVARSCEDTDWFWEEALKYMGVKWTREYKKLMDSSDGFEWTKWFVDGELNIVDNILDWHMEKGKTLGARTSVGKDHPALIFEDEEGEPRKYTYGELSELVSKTAGVMKKLGVGKGDAVGIYMPMVPEVVAVLFACFKIGAVAVPVFSGFGSQALAARLEDSEAKVLFTADGGVRRGKLVEIKKDADQAADAVASVKHVVVLKHTANEVAWREGRDLWLHEELEKAESVATVCDLPAEHPSMYLYTSGTTGKPKGMVHTHGGALAQISKELGFCFDVQPEDVAFQWVTDIGWMILPR
ncbi:MAG: AMP-binding protein [Cyanobacteriota/Melainabacteria group bacterium]